MFQTTFLGHQGWLVSTATTHVLIDPLLTEDFGHGGLVGVMYPPRHLELTAFPPIDAVVITHEHDDHFDIPSLHRLDRSIPLYLSARSSTAAHDLLDHMGFEVHPLHSDQTLELGDLRYSSFCADHLGGANGDEWDVFPFLVHDASGHGSLLSSIDVGLPEGMLSKVRERVARAGIWAYANNTTSARVQDATHAGHALPDDGAALAQVAYRRYESIERGWGPPAATLICGGGFSFAGSRTWLDHHVFSLDSEQIRAALVESDPRRRVSVAAPGQSVIMRDGQWLEARPRREFIEALARERWPSREYAGDGARLGAYDPACGRRACTPNEIQIVRSELDDFARFLYGRPFFHQLCSLPTQPRKGRSATMGLALRTEAGRVVFRYDPSGCRFVEHEGVDPLVEWMSGLECWASDLLALFRGEIGPTALCYAGRMRVWNADVRRLRISPHELWTFAHPLRRPAAAAALYRRLLDAQPPRVATIRGRGSP